MIETRKGDLFRGIPQSESILIVHGCNNRGVMGKGFALTLKQKYPQVYQAYREKYEKQNNHLELGDIIPVVINNNLIIVNMITQDGYAKSRYDSRVYVEYSAVEKGFRQLEELCNDRFVSEVHFPLIGCGLANGNWPTVEKIILENLKTPKKVLWKL